MVTKAPIFKMSTALSELVLKNFAEMNLLEKEFRTHDVYHVEDWQEIIFIPGGRKLFRVHYIFDATTDKALIKRHDGKVKLLEMGKEIERLHRTIHHPIKSFRNGIFSRRLRPERPSFLFDLFLIMSYRGDLALPMTSKEKVKAYLGRREEYIEMMFNLVISEK